MVRVDIVCEDAGRNGSEWGRGVRPSRARACRRGARRRRAHGRAQNRCRRRQRLHREWYGSQRRGKRAAFDAALECWFAERRAFVSPADGFAIRVGGVGLGGEGVLGFLFFERVEVVVVEGPEEAFAAVAAAAFHFLESAAGGEVVPDGTL